MNNLMKQNLNIMIQQLGIGWHCLASYDSLFKASKQASPSLQAIATDLTRMRN